MLVGVTPNWPEQVNAETAELLLPSILTGRLVVLTGAGLSMAAPSCLPSAADLADSCARKHELTGEVLPRELHSRLPDLACQFYQRGQLASYFLTRLVAWRPFLGEPNRGHEAIADFLGCGACDCTVTANVDFLVENAARRLGEPAFESALDGDQAAIELEHRPYLKLHGCCQKARRETLWCPAQLDEGTWQGRVGSSSRWLDARLPQRDVLIVGYWTDWDYLNRVLLSCLGNALPRAVVIVDPSSSEALELKAPDLWAWAARPEINRIHERMSGDQFLDELRARFSAMLLREIVETGRGVFVAAGGRADTEPPLFNEHNTTDLYALRRDWTGTPSNMVSRSRAASLHHEQFGAFVLRLVAAGAALEGPYFAVRSSRVRVIHAAGRLLYTVRRDFRAGAFPGNHPDITVCVGAEDDGGVPADIVRSGEGPSILRPGDQGKWCTHREAPMQLGID